MIFYEVLWLAFSAIMLVGPAWAGPMISRPVVHLSAYEEGCFGNSLPNFGPKFNVGLQAVEASPKSYLGVQDLEDVTGWLEREYRGSIGVSIDYDALTFNARALIEAGGKRKVILNLGLILNPKITKDVIALIGCHEVGHHLGGVPLHSKYPVSVEGQADYFAPQACFHRWLYAKILSGFTIREEVQAFCRSTGILPKYRLEHCGRAIEASVRLSEIFAERKRSEVFPWPRLGSSDTTTVDVTLDRHGSPQCRLDTFRSGFLSFALKESPRPGCWFSPAVGPIASGFNDAEFAFVK